MATNESVLAICVNWNGRDVLRETLESLQKSDYPSLEILVVDNASTDASLETIPDSVSVLKLEENRGYAGAVNAGMQLVLPSLARARAEKPALPLPTYFFILNYDIIVEPTLVSSLVEIARSRGPGVYGPKVLRHRDSKRLDAAWGYINWSHVLTRYYGKGERDSARWSATKRVDLLLGCALLIHWRVVEEVGLFDETFFMYHEEADFLYRASSKGFPIYYCGLDYALHRGAYATRDQPEQKLFWVRRNAVYFLRKHRPVLMKWAFFLATLSLSLIYNLLALRWKRVQVIARGVRAGLRLEPRNSRI
ncbi:MAG: glycosyltransferase family 2 protein [Acidobacteriota bacterium]